MPVRTSGLYFDEFLLDEEHTSPGRTITETDVVNFSCLSGDWTPIHSDVEYAKSSFFGQRLAHGALVFSIATGLVARMGVIEETAIALTSLSVKFSKPVFIGDTVRVKMKAIKKRAVSPEAGIVIAQVNVVNQREETVESGEWTVMVKRKQEQVDA